MRPSWTTPRMTTMETPAGEADDEMTGEIADLTYRLTGRIWEHFTSRAASFGLSVPEAKALNNLELGKPVPMRIIADRLHANPSNISVTISRLESRGLIVRQGGDDRRVKGVQLTPAGKDLQDQLAAALLKNHPAVRGMSANQKATLLKLLRRMDRGD